MQETVQSRLEQTKDLGAYHQRPLERERLTLHFPLLFFSVGEKALSF